MVFNGLKFKKMLLITGGLFAVFSSPAQSQDNKKFSPPRHYAPSTSQTGMLGLNTVPSARMDKKGTIRLGAGTSDPYVHSFIGFQLTTPFYVSLRQSSQVSSLLSDPDAFYPGVDFKLRLAEETSTRPAIAIGMDSALGNKRLASEYLSFSKRYNNFDFTGGIAWGRLGSAGHIKNPLRAVSSHFEKARNLTAQYDSQDINGWFTGEEIGFFGGVEYFSPIKGLSFKLDYGADDYVGAQTIEEFDAPPPWSIGLNYKPINQIDLSAGIIGGKKIMARLSLQDQLGKWIGRPANKVKSPELITPRTAKNGKNKAALSLSPHRPTGKQIGQIARLVANKTDESAESITIALKHKGLKGPILTLIRSDLERGILNAQRSPDEIWQSTIIEENTSPNFDFKKLLDKNLFSPKNDQQNFKFILDQKLSLSESDAGILYRTSAILETEKTWPLGIITGASARANIANNLSNLNKYRFRSTDPVRSDEDLFAGRRFGIDRFYTTWLTSLSPSTHMSLNAGYLEEMYGGYGGEILYRPFGKTFAIGTEGWIVHKRDPLSTLNKTMNEDSITTGHLNLFYEMPNESTTAYLKLGQYLREDRGGTFGLKNIFENGSTLEGYISVTNQADADILGNKTYAYGGIKFTLPFGNIPYVPSGSEARFTVEPFSRDSAQTLDKPQPLYEVTEPIAYRNLSQSWKHLLD